MVKFCHKNNIISDKKCTIAELSRNLHFLTLKPRFLSFAAKKSVKTCKF